MSRKMFFLTLFAILQITSCLSSCWFWKLIDLEIDLIGNVGAQRCDVEKEYKKIFDGKKCQNLIPAEGDNNWRRNKIYLEIMNETSIKQWTINRFSQSSIQFKLGNYSICKIPLKGVFDSNFEMVFASNMSYYYSTWDIYDSRPNPSVMFLTSDISSYIVTTPSYVMVFTFSNKTLTQNVFSKKLQKFTNSYTLQRSIMRVINVESLPSKNTTLVITYEDGTQKNVDIIFPVTYINQKNYYKSSYTSSSSNISARDALWFVIALVIIMLKLWYLWSRCVSNAEERASPPPTQTFRSTAIPMRWQENVEGRTHVTIIPESTNNDTKHLLH